MNEIFFNLFKKIKFLRFFEIGIWFKYILNDNFCLLISFFKSSNKPSDISIEVLAKSNNLLVKSNCKFGK